MPVRYFVLILVGLCAGAQPGHAQTRATTVAVEWIQPGEVPARAEALLSRLDEIRPESANHAALDRIDAGLAKMSPTLDAAIERANAALVRSASPRELEDVRRELAAAAGPLAGWKGELTVEVKRVADVLDEIARAQHVWSETRDRPETTAAGDVVARRVQASLAALAEAGVTVRARRARVLATSDALVDRSTAVDATVEKLQAAALAERANLFVPDREPLWRSGFGAALRSELPRAPEEIRALSASTRQYVKQDPRPLVVQALLAVVLILVFRTFAARVRTRLGAEQGAARATRLLERPYSIGLLLALLASPVLHPLAPRRLLQVISMVGFLAAARIVIHASDRANLPAFVGLFVMFVLDRIGLAVVPLPALARATFLLILVMALGLAFWLRRRVRLTEGGTPWLQRAVDIAMVGLTLALLADVGGWTNLAAFVGRGIIAGAISLLYVYASVIVLSAALAYVLTSATVRRSNLFARNMAVVQRRTEHGLLWIGAVFWAYLVTMALGLRGAAAEALGRLLGAGLSVGALSISIGDVLAFVVTLLAAILLARLVNGVLEEEIYPRTHLPRGIPYVLSALVRYSAYSLGFLFALAAAGVQIGQVTILVGGLGVGVGLGLQDLVKNFAAGLTLLLERRVHVGDALQIPSQDVFGRVLSIGMRATVIRNWNGAEVVVPNSDLVSTAVTNWTLSDVLRRIEVAVGVAYGTDPEQVVRLLLEVAKSIPHILDAPEPSALFRGFGESSLDFVLRAWTNVEYEKSAALTSDLAIAVHRRLSEAGIAIPFPQRDLHLASVAPEVSAALSGVPRKG
jgi:potassium-dependent mechanosensitive channel